MIISYKFIRNDTLVTDTDICKAVKTIQIPLLKVTSSEHLSSIITLSSSIWLLVFIIFLLLNLNNCCKHIKCNNTY